MMTPEEWAKNSREAVKHARRWAETMRGASLATYQGMLGDQGLVEVLATTHDQLLELWEKSANSAIDHTLTLAATLTPKTPKA